MRQDFMSSTERLPTHQCTRDAVATHLKTSMLAETERYLAKLRASAEATEIISSAEDEGCQARTGAVLAPSACDGGPGSEASRSEDELGPEATPPLGHGPGRVRVSAVLQVIAVVMILAFILFQPT
jgi:hypothetical protein